MLNRRRHAGRAVQGSVGASGDLAPLAHMTLTLIGEGEAYYRGERLPSAVALERAGLKPVDAGAKGRARAHQRHAGDDRHRGARRFARRTARRRRRRHRRDVAGSVSRHRARLRPPPQRPASASGASARCRQPARAPRRTRRSCSRIASAAACKIRTRSAAFRSCTARCATRSAHVRRVTEIEANSVTDNPLGLPGRRRVSLGRKLPRRTDRARDRFLEDGDCGVRVYRQSGGCICCSMPKIADCRSFSRGRSGLQSGLMIVQYTAAALVNDNKGLAWPSSVDSIPTSAGQEDHVSMGMTSANNLLARARQRRRRARLRVARRADRDRFPAAAPLGTGTQAAYDRRAGVRSRRGPKIARRRPISPPRAS